jgi:HEAT repeat protein
VVHDLVLRIALVLLVVSLPAWVALSAAVLLGRAQYDRRARLGGAPPTERELRRLLRLAEKPSRTEWGRWRRVTALNRLAGMRDPAAPHLLHKALEDDDSEVVSAAIRDLGALGDEWAVELLVEALRDGRAPRSRVAAQLERLAPAPGMHLLHLLRDEDPAARFWGATLLGPYEDFGDTALVALTRDADANVRAAAVEALATRSGREVKEAVLRLLDDPEWFVRVHAARSAGHVAGAGSAFALAGLLGHERWWVRTAAKDALEGIGADAVPALIPVLSSYDEFARNGAAEVLQDIGLVDHLALEDPRNPLLARIYAAGGRKLREAAEARVARLREERQEQAA